MFKAIKMNEILRGKKKGQGPSTKCSRSSRGLGTVKRAAARGSAVQERCHGSQNRRAFQGKTREQCLVLLRHPLVFTSRSVIGDSTHGFNGL